MNEPSTPSSPSYLDKDGRHRAFIVAFVVREVCMISNRKFASQIISKNKLLTASEKTILNEDG
ncbi:13964_t:CDS:2 [Entrophospora sp. SA101]|nr:13964_t:CDS:2 [Entrophospora sp. SA101]